MSRLVFIYFLFTHLLGFSNQREVSTFSPVFTNYTSNHGLPSSQIYQVKQDKRGYVWFTTENGISRFDGNEFTNFTNETGLCVRTVFGIYEDKKDRVWFYSYSGEVVYYSYKNNKMHCPAFNTKLKALTEGKILNGLFVTQDTLTTFDYFGNTYKVSLITDEISFASTVDSNSYINQSGIANLTYGIIKTSKKLTVDLEGFHFKTNEDFNCLNGLIPTALIGQNHKVYFAACERLLLIDTEQKQINQETINFQNTQSFFEDSKGIIWLGTFNNGVYGWSSDSNKLNLRYKLLKGYTVTSIFEDRNGGYWFTTQNNGVFYTQNLLTKKISDQHPLVQYASGRINSIKNLKNSLIISGDRKAAINLDSNDNLSVLKKPSKRYFVLGQELVEKEYLINKIKPRLKSEYRNHVSLSYLKSIDKSFYFLVSTVNKTYIIAEKLENAVNVQKEFSAQGIAGSLKEFCLTKKSHLYAGSNSSLYHLHLPKNALNEITFKNDKIEVTSITPWYGDSVFVSTRNLGILLVSGDSVVQELNTTSGFPFTFCNHVFIDGDTLYGSTNRGVFQIVNPIKKKKYNRLTQQNGLLSNEILESIKFKNSLYLATNKGLCVVDLSLFSKKPNILPCRIEKVSVNNKNVDKNQSNLKLNYSQNYLSFSYSANSFENAFSVPYRYRLKNNEKWVATKSNSLTLSNLLPGKYQFEVQAAGANGNWGKSALFSFIIEPAFWQSGWFFCLLVLLLTLTAFLIYKYRMRRITQLQSLKNTLYNTQQMALGSQIKPHFVFNSLNSISNALLNNDVKTSVLYLGKFGKLMRRIFDYSQETFITLEEEVQLLKSYLEVEKIRLKEKLSYSIDLPTDLQGAKIYLPALLIQPFIENAIWHGIAKNPKGGKVKLTILLNKKQLIFKVEDDGPGINQSINQDSLNTQLKTGLNITLKRVLLINKLFQKNIYFSIEPIESNAGTKTGTVVHLTLPVLNAKPKSL